MINQAGGAPQFPNNILQSGVQNGGVQQNPQERRAESNKPQENRNAEATSAQKANDSQNQDFQKIAEDILASRAQQSNNDPQFQPAVERGSIVDITV